MRLRTAKARFAVENINLEAAAAVPGARWEPFQIDFLNETGLFAIWLKARQVAWSFTAACDAYVDGILNAGTPHAFVSINMDEATEKIRYIRALWEATNPLFRPPITKSSETRIELLNGSRFISHPSRPPRGRAKLRVYLDEWAHYKEGVDGEIYTAALPAMTKGGYLRAGSSPLGAVGMFWEVFSEAMRPYPGFTRYNVPWWEVQALCKDVRKAKVHAPAMMSEERVLKYGSPVLVEIFLNMFLDDFQQEYECMWVDEAVAWLPWYLIRKNQDANLIWSRGTTNGEVDRVIAELDLARHTNKITGDLVAGIDIGRKRHTTEVVIVEDDEGGNKVPLRAIVSLPRTDFDDQKVAISTLVRKLGLRKVLIDETGLGMNLAEDLSKKFTAVEGRTFTMQSKEDWAKEARLRMERVESPIPQDKDFAYQIHSIKKKVTPSKNVIYDVDRNEKHHADLFWAWALSLEAAGTVPAGAIEVLESNYIRS